MTGFLFISPGFVDNFVFLTPAINPPAPIEDPVSCTPISRLRTVRIIQPSKALLPPFSCITSSKHQDSIYEKVIIHHPDSEFSKLKRYSIFSVLL